MFLILCLALFLLWCKCIQINAQCTIKGCDIKDTVSMQENADEVLELLNRMNNHGQNLQRQFEKLLIQTERQGNESKDVVLAQTNANQISQLQNRLDSKIENLELQLQKLLNQTERQIDEKMEVLLAQAVANQTSQLQNRLDNQSQSLWLQFQKLLHQHERQDVLLAQNIANQTSELQNRLDYQSQNLQLQFHNLVNKTERQVKGETQSIAEQILQLWNRLDNNDQNLQLQFQKLLNQTENQGNKDKDVVLAQTISNQTSQLRNRLDDQSQKLQLQFQNLVNQTERQVRRCEIEDKVSAQGIADQILQLRNQTVQLLCRDLETQIERQDICGPIPSLRDCSDIRANGQRTSGVYTVYVEHQQKLYSANAYCDLTTSANRNSWLVFQRRKDGSVDFYRNWREYETGFGDPNGEFWLGNEMLHLLTSKRNYKLRIDLEDFEGNRRYADYARFSIGPPSDNYTLNINGYSGNAGDSMEYHNGRQFITKDVDNDGVSDNCAEYSHGAWWYHYCCYSNLNGKYHRGNYSGINNGVYWQHWHGFYYSLKTSEMKIAPATDFT